MNHSANPVQHLLVAAVWTLSLVWPVTGYAQAAASEPLKWEAASGFRRAKLAVGQQGKTGFTLLPPSATGIHFTNLLAEERHLTNQILLNGSGVAAGDVDGDGRCDLYFCGLDRPNSLYRNLGNWQFQDITSDARVACPDLDATGAAFADLDGDNDLDLIVNSVGGGTHIFLNDGKAHFTERAVTPALNARRGGMSLALADVDGDGDLDLYVANYRTVTIRDQPNTRFSIRTVDGKRQVVSVDGRSMTDPELANRFVFRISEVEGGGTFAYDENGEPDVLFRNEGNGRFTPLSFTNGTFLDEQGRPLLKLPFDWGLSATFRDINGDGAPDLYVCNDFKSPDRIWINDGHGRFQAIAPLALRQTCLSSMGIDFADIDRDGFDDFLVVDMLSLDHFHRHTERIDIKPDVLPIGATENRPQYPRNMLFLNRGDGTFAEVAQLSGLEASEWSWTPIFLDVDLDGYEDLLVSNGFERDGMNVDVLRRLELTKKQKALSPLEQLRLRKMFPRLESANLAFRNLGNLRFEDTSDVWGFNLRTISQGMALADLDNDGDLDVVINNLNAPAAIYRNDTPAPRLAVRLKGQPPNTHGIGARIKISGGPVTQNQEIICGGRYLSSDEPMRTFACGPGDMTIEVTWRSGKRSVVSGVKSNHLYEIDESAAGSGATVLERHQVGASNGGRNLSDGSSTNAPRHAPVLFEDVSHLLKHQHVEDPFEDFAVQPTLPNRLSQLGPGVSWFDVDGDGWDDLIIGSGRGGRLAVFHNDGGHGFTRRGGIPLDQPVTRDQTTVLAWPKAGGQTVLIAGSANYEDGLTNGSVARFYDLAAKAVTDILPGQESSTGPLAMADIDGDGNLDLFVGGRAVAGRYGEPASSMLFRSSGGQLVLDRDNSKALMKVGLVSGAVFSDLDGDGDPDLVLACEWGSLRIFRNDHGRLTPWNPRVTFSPSASASSQLETRNPKPETLSNLTGWWNGVATGDFDGDGRLDIAASNWGQNTRYERFRTEPLRLYYGDVLGNGTSHVIEGYISAHSKQLLPLQPFHLIGTALPPIRERVGTFETYAKSALNEIYGESWKKMNELQANWLESTVFLNRGDRFEPIVLPVEAQMAPAFAVCAGDLDGDGSEDLFLSQNFFAVQPDISRYDAGRGLWLRGDGRGGFKAVPGRESGIKVYGEQRGAALCDFDADGRPDLAVTQNAAETKLYRNVRATPGLRVRLNGPPGNPLGIGAALRLVFGQRAGPIREVRAGSGYGSQDSAIQVLCAPEAPKQLWVRWPGGKVTITDLPAAAREVSLDVNGGITLLR